MGFLPLWVLFGALVVTIGIALFGGGGVLWLCPAIVLAVIVILAVTMRRVGEREHHSNRAMNTPEPRER
jgi:Na+-transporting methylmalonyl-CoA/oxaloacetate decarboxylase gamma subunit